MYDVDVKREEGKVLVLISSIQSWSEGPYRCVSENSSAPDNSSESLTIPLHCEWESDLGQDLTSWAVRIFRNLFKTLYIIKQWLNKHKSICLCLQCLNAYLPSLSIESSWQWHCVT